MIIGEESQPDTGATLDVGVGFPVFAGRLVVTGRQAVCYVSDREVRIVAPAKLLVELVRLCDGHATMAEILAELRKAWSEIDLKSFMSALAEQGVLCEASRLAEQWWTFWANAGPLPSKADIETAAARLSSCASSQQAISREGFSDLLRRRSSGRTFGSGRIPYSILSYIHWAAYGFSEHRTVPSAGGLYPLEIYWINLRSTDGLAVGAYRIEFPAPGEVCAYTISDDLAMIARSITECDLLLEAQGIVVVSGKLAVTAARYGARAALYVPLEAGHVAQNVLLAATECGVAAVEVGGFYKSELSALLKLSGGSVPLTSIFLGSAPSQEELANTKDAPSIQYQWLETEGLPYAPPFVVCGARLQEQKGDWSWGRSSDPALAHVKASAEAQERWSCMQPSGLCVARMDELENAVDPRTIVAYSEHQYARVDFPFRPFRSDCTYLWKEGVEVRTGAAKAVLAECLFFAGALDCPRPYTEASSSGAAAYPTEQGAMERAVLELVERDAFMRAWLGQSATPTIELGSLPRAMQKRVQRLRGAGVDVKFGDLSSGLVPSILAFAQSSEAGFTTTAAGAAYDPEEALNNAFMEVEHSVALRLATPTPRRLEPLDVRTPADHVDLYSQRRYYKRADFLVKAGPAISLSEAGVALAAGWSDLYDRLHGRGQSVIWFNLTPPGAGLYRGRSPLFVGRAVVPGLLPIAFGYGCEPLASFEMQGRVSGHRRPSSKPHLVSLMFPHPFG